MLKTWLIPYLQPRMNKDSQSCDSVIANIKQSIPSRASKFDIQIVLFIPIYLAIMPEVR